MNRNWFATKSLGIVALFIMIAGCGGGKQTSGDSVGAFVFCKDFVRDRLKSPSTADFPFRRTTSDLGNNTYVITSYVDSQNLFGATVRSHWSCKIRHRATEDAWELLDLKFTTQ